MKKHYVEPVENCNKTIRVQGDKSISHRAVIIGSLAKGTTKIKNFLEAEDCLDTINVYRELGIRIEKKKDIYSVESNGLFSFREPSKTLYVGNSGTSIRLTLGVLSGQHFTSTITGDAQVEKRPMNRVILPLSQMGAKFQSTNGHAPVTVTGTSLRGITYRMPVASAQVKSSIMLAALHAQKSTEIIEPMPSRDHTERMLKYFGADIKMSKNRIKIKPGKELKARNIYVPGDISSSAYFIIAGLLMKNSKITIRETGLNPSRTGIVEVMKKMGAKIIFKNIKMRNNEPVGDIIAKTSGLKGTVIKGGLIPKLIDEIPVIAVAAAFAEGRTIIKDAKELRVKETDRIETVVKNLKRMGVKVEEKEDGMIIYGSNGRPFKYADIDSYGDHRIAMSFAIAALVSDNGLLIKDVECVNTSFPEFFNILKNLKK